MIFYNGSNVAVERPKGIRHGTVVAVSAAALDDKRFKE